MKSRQGWLNRKMHCWKLIVGLLCTAMLCAAGCQNQSKRETHDRYSNGNIVAQLQSPALTENSGLVAASDGRHFFLINDSGNSNELFEVDETFNLSRRFPIQGVSNLDWEDMTRFNQDGHARLLIADTGDNLQARKSIRLIAVNEPDQSMPSGAPLNVEWIVDANYPSGALDCEAVTFDAQTHSIVFITKREGVPRVFAMPLPNTMPLPQQTLKFWGRLKGIELPLALEKQQDPVLGKFRHQITGAAMHPSGNELAIQSYRGSYVLQKAPSQSWQQALKKQRAHLLEAPLLPQAEAISYSLDGNSLFVTSERTPNGVVRFDLKH